MKTLVIYDTTGRIIFQGNGDILEPVGIPFLWLEIPDGKILKYIDTSKTEHVPVYEDLPKSQVEILSEQVAALNIALAEVLGV